MKVSFPKINIHFFTENLAKLFQKILKKAYAFLLTLIIRKFQFFVDFNSNFESTLLHNIFKYSKFWILNFNILENYFQHWNAYWTSLSSQFQTFPPQNNNHWSRVFLNDKFLSFLHIDYSLCILRNKNKHHNTSSATKFTQKHWIGQFQELVLRNQKILTQ